MTSLCPLNSFSAGKVLLSSGGTFLLPRCHLYGGVTNVSTLMIEAGKDLCTLVTCTPYGINSHRLLVRGHRIENQDEAQAIRVTSDAIQIEPLIVAPAVALPMLLVLLVILLVSGGKTKSAGGKKNAKTE